MPAKKKFSRALFDRVLSRIDAGQGTHVAVEREGIHPATFYRHVEKDPELRSLYRAQRDARDILAMEREAYRRAVEGNDKPVYQGGKKVGTVKEYSDGLLTFLLKARKPEVYAKPDVQMVSNTTTVVNVEERTKKEEDDFVRKFQKVNRGMKPVNGDGITHSEG